MYRPNLAGPRFRRLSSAAPLPNDAFANFTSVFGSPANLGDNAIGITELPQDTPLEAQLAYDGASKVLTLSMFTVGPGNVLTPLNTELVPLDLGAFGSGYDSLNSFLVNSLSIMAYNDGYTGGDDPSLVGDMRFDFVSLTLVPEPSTLVLGLVAAFVCPAIRSAARARRRRTWSDGTKRDCRSMRFFKVCHAGRVRARSARDRPRRLVCTGRRPARLNRNRQRQSVDRGVGQRFSGSGARTAEHHRSRRSPGVVRHRQ